MNETEIKTYVISEDGRSIQCLGCGFTSYHPMDVKEKYCGHCHVFHEDIWPPDRQWFVEQRQSTNNQRTVHERQTEVKRP